MYIQPAIINQYTILQLIKKDISNVFLSKIDGYNNYSKCTYFYLFLSNKVNIFKMFDKHKMYYKPTQY